MWTATRIGGLGKRRLIPTETTPGVGTRARSRSRSSMETVEEHPGIGAHFRRARVLRGRLGDAGDRLHQQINDLPGIDPTAVAPLDVVPAAGPRPTPPGPESGQSEAPEEDDVSGDSGPTEQDMYEFWRRQSSDDAVQQRVRREQGVPAGFVAPTPKVAASGALPLSEALRRWGHLASRPLRRELVIAEERRVGDRTELNPQLTSAVAPCSSPYHLSAPTPNAEERNAVLKEKRKAEEHRRLKPKPKGGGRGGADDHD